MNKQTKKVKGAIKNHKLVKRVSDETYCLSSSLRSAFENPGDQNCPSVDVIRRNQVPVDLVVFFFPIMAQKNGSSFNLRCYIRFTEIWSIVTED